VIAALEADLRDLTARAQRLVSTLAANGIDAHAAASSAAVGGGGAPGVVLPSAAVSLPEAFATVLRTGQPAVVGRIERGRCLLDLRSVPPAHDEVLAGAVRAAAAWTASRHDGPAP
jgi:L-seryl-tRNA(Ser) seleniumtransferase